VLFPGSTLEEAPSAGEGEDDDDDDELARGSVMGSVARPLPSWVLESGTSDETRGATARSSSAVLHSRLHLALAPTLRELRAACEFIQHMSVHSQGTHGGAASPSDETEGKVGLDDSMLLTPVAAFRRGVGSMGSGQGEEDGGGRGGSVFGSDSEPDYAALLRHYARAADFMMNEAEQAVATSQHAEHNAFAAEAAARDAVEVDAFDSGLDLERAKQKAEDDARQQGQMFRAALGAAAVLASVGVIVYGFSSHWGSTASAAKKSRRAMGNRRGR